MGSIPLKIGDPFLSLTGFYFQIHPYRIDRGKENCDLCSRNILHCGQVLAVRGGEVTLKAERTLLLDVEHLRIAFL